MRRIYIHQLPEWPEFHFDWTEVSPVLARARSRHSNLLDQAKPLDPKRVSYMVDRRIQLNGPKLGRTRSATKGVEAVMRDAIDNYSEPLTKERLIQWHNDLHSAGRDFLGKVVSTDWRDDRYGPTIVGCVPLHGQLEEQFEPPLAGRLKNEMERFITWFNSPDDSDGVIRAGVAHLWFVTIHPFFNGNGRIARVITDMALARADATSYRYYSMSHQIVKERAAYYSVLEQTQNGTLNITKWIGWFLQCFERSIARSEKVLAAASAEERFWQTHEESQFNTCQRNMIDWLFENFGSGFTVGTWAAIAKCCHDTAYYDIADLAARGVLVWTSGCGRSARYQLVHP